MPHPHCQYENQRPVRLRLRLRLCLCPCSCPYRPCRCRPCHQEHVVQVVKVILHGRVLLRTVEQIVRAPALQITLQERFRHESPRSVWMPSVPDFGKRCPRGEALSSTRIHQSPGSFSRIVFLGRQRNRRSVFRCHLFFPSRKKSAHLSSRPSNEFTIFDLISAHREKMQRENFGPDSLKPAIFELERQTQDRGVSAKPR